MMKRNAFLAGFITFVFGVIFSGIVFISTDKNEREILPTVTPSPTIAPIVFTAVGDFTSNKNAEATLQLIGKINPDLNLALGDLSYGDKNDLTQESKWCDFVKINLKKGGISDAQFPFQLISGNHEDDNMPNGHIDRFIKCLPDNIGVTGDYGKHYYFDQSNVRFIMLSPDLKLNGREYTYTNGSSEYLDVKTWLEDVTTKQIDWVIVGTHKMCITAGEKPTCEIGKDLMNLLLEYKVDLVLQGHEHAYQRSAQLVLGDKCKSLVIDGYDTNCVSDDSASDVYVKGAGTIIINSGAGGKDLYKINEADAERKYFWKVMGKGNADSYGVAKFVINGKKLSGEFISSNGDFADTFVIE